MSRPPRGPVHPAIRCGILLLTSALFLPACDTARQPTAPTTETGDQELQAILFDAIQDEYHAEAVYQGVVDDFGQVLPFANILMAEVRHSAAIGSLYESRGWAVPAGTWTTENVPHFASTREACAVGVDAEIANVAVYDALLAQGDLPDDVLQVFTSNRWASLERHLPAFQSCM